MGDRGTSISEKTLIPVSLMLVVIVASLWISSVAHKAEAGLSMAGECAQDFKRIDERLSRIEGKLGIASRD